jgi:hypothetical protein
VSTANLGIVLDCDGVGCGGELGAARFGRAEGRDFLDGVEEADLINQPGFDSTTEAREIASRVGWVSYWGDSDGNPVKKGRGARLTDRCPACQPATLILPTTNKTTEVAP